MYVVDDTPLAVLRMHLDNAPMIYNIELCDANVVSANMSALCSFGGGGRGQREVN